MDEYTRAFGERVRQRRKELGMTQLDLGLKMGFKSKQSVCHIEAGDRNLKQSQVVALANALGVTPAYLMGWKTSEEEKKEIEKNRLIDIFENLSDVARAKLLGYAEGLAEKN